MKILNNVQLRLKKINDLLNKSIETFLISIISLIFISKGYAALPTVSNPDGVTASDNYIVWLQEWIEDIGIHAGSAVSMVLFVWAAWILFSKFNDARNSSNPDWGGVALVAIIAAILLVVVTFFLVESAAVFAP